MDTPIFKLLVLVGLIYLWIQSLRSAMVGKWLGEDFTIRRDKHPVLVRSRLQ
jgi:hypothetical protein